VPEGDGQWRLYRPARGRRLAWLIFGLGAVFAGVWLLYTYFRQPLDRQTAEGGVVSMFTGIVGLFVAWHQPGVSVMKPAPDEQRDVRDPLRQHLGRQNRLRRMDDPATRALALRVHPAISLPQSAGPAAMTAGSRSHLPGPDDARSLDRDLPAFVERDTGPEVLEWLRRAREHGGFLVLIGGSSVGKTRLLYEATREVTGDFEVLVPDLGDGDLVNKIAGATSPLPRLIVWLDELQRFLEGPYLTPGSAPITAQTVRYLLTAPTPVIIVGTAWLSYATRLGATEADPATGHPQFRYPSAADILDLADIVNLETFSDDERSAAKKLMSHDPRLAEALADPHYNVTEVLAGAPELIRRYQQATEEQKAVLHAALDARRLGTSGMQGPLSEGFLRDAARLYLSTVHPDDTWFPPALAELTSGNRPHDRAMAPLIPIPSADRTHVRGYIVADYLLQHLPASSHTERLHDMAKLLAGQAPASSPPPARAVSTEHPAGLAETLLNWAGNAIVIDPGAALWRATARQRDAMGSRIIRFELAGVQEPSLSYNPLREIRRRTPTELEDFTEMFKPLVNDPSEKGEAAALLLLAVFSRYMEDTTEPSLRGMAQFIEEPSFYSGMQLLSYLSNVQDPTRPGHLFAAALAEEFEKLDDEDFVEEMLLRSRGALSLFTSYPIGDRTEHHDLLLAELVASEKLTTLYVTFPKHHLERWRPFVRMLCAQFARGLREAATLHTTLIAIDGTDALGPNALQDLATSPVEGIDLVTHR
jgi:hypothetical protein